MSYDAYAAPADLPEEGEETSCQTDVTLTIKEPTVPGTQSARPSGTSRTGVKQIKVTLAGGGRFFTQPLRRTAPQHSAMCRAARRILRCLRTNSRSNRAAA